MWARRRFVTILSRYKSITYVPIDNLRELGILNQPQQDTTLLLILIAIVGMAAGAALGQILDEYVTRN